MAAASSSRAESLRAEARFPVYAANVADEKGAAIANTISHKLIEMDGVRLGVIGLTAEDSVKRSSPGDLQFSSSLEDADVGA